MRAVCTMNGKTIEKYGNSRGMKEPRSLLPQENQGSDNEEMGLAWK